MTVLGSGGLIVIPPGGPPGPIGPPGLPGAPGFQFPQGPVNFFQGTTGGSALAWSLLVPGINQQIYTYAYFSAINSVDPNSYSFGQLFGLFKVDNVGVLSQVSATGFTFNGPSAPPPSLFTQLLAAPNIIELYVNNTGIPDPTDFQVQSVAMIVTSPNIPP